MEMTPAQRLILSNQYTLMAQLDPSNSDKYARLKTIIERGYGLQIRELDKDFGDMSADTCQDVINSMELYHALQASYHLLDEATQADIDERRLQFWGYDAASESQLMHYVRFLTKTEGLYPQFDYSQHQFNSQTPMREKYQRMYLEWQNCPRQYRLCANEIIKIINA